MSIMYGTVHRDHLSNCSEQSMLESFNKYLWSAYCVPGTKNKTIPSSS